uniref:Phosphoglycerate mutase-like protein n=1 Tax=Aureoumbra lagunensis TaxID=44058 RepID=A0A7S3JXA2_9STRA|mmetsp:Transcript_15657/g.23573  ORF Transcript_15657/g.23573 Transcript_15657/m.23573 type:complete len:299 (+) Transcript_15657:43-939(+)
MSNIRRSSFALFVVFARSARGNPHQNRLLSNTALHLRAGVSEGENDDEQTIIFVRHAEGWHNKHAIELPNWHSDRLGLQEKYRDANLTPDGIEQCHALANRIENDPNWIQPDVVVVSPLTRTIRTATLGFRDGPYPFVATELARERIAQHKCDQRSKLSDLTNTYSHVDFSEIHSDEDILWLTKEVEPEEYNSTLCSQRAMQFLTWLRRRPERRIAVVSHWVFLKHLFALFPEQHDLQEKFGNAEMRTVVLSGGKTCELGGETTIRKESADAAADRSSWDTCYAPPASLKEPVAAGGM